MLNYNLSGDNAAFSIIIICIEKFLIHFVFVNDNFVILKHCFSGEDGRNGEKYTGEEKGQQLWWHQVISLQGQAFLFYFTAFLPNGIFCFSL